MKNKIDKVNILGIKRFYKYIGKDKYLTIFQLFLFIVLGMMDAIPTLIMAAMIDVLSGQNALILGILVPKDTSIVFLISILFLTWIIVEIGEQQLRAWIRIKSKHYIFSLRKDLHSSAIAPNNNLEPKLTRGDIALRASNDIYSVNSVYTFPMCDAVSPIMKSVFSLGYLFFLDYRIGLIALATIPLFIILSKNMISQDFSTTKQIKKSQSKSNNYLINMLHNFKMITLFGGNQTEIDYYKKINHEISDKEIWLAKRYRTFWFLMNVLKLIVCVSALLIASFSIIDGIYSAGLILLIYSYTKNTYQPIFSTTLMISAAISGSVEMERVFNLMDKLPFETGFSSTKPIKNIEFKNVDLKYGDKLVLSNISCILKKDKINYIIGASGKGKSMLTTAIYSLLHVSNGCLKVNNKKVKFINFDHLSVSLQTSAILNRSIEQNLLYPNEKELNKTLINTLNVTDDLIYKEDKYLTDSSIETISGGEKQKINLYRCLSKIKDIYILDEPTNNLDELTITKLKNYLGLQVGKAIYIVVTHNKEFILPNQNVIEI